MVESDPFILTGLSSQQISALCACMAKVETMARQNGYYSSELCIISDYSYWLTSALINPQMYNSVPWNKFETQFLFIFPVDFYFITV